MIARPRKGTPLSTKRKSRSLALIGGVVALALTVSACGSSNDSSDSGVTPSQGAPGSGIDFQAVQQCLTAAGIKLKLPSGAPSGGFPSGVPTGSPPSGFPSGGPTGAPPSGFGDGSGANLFSQPKVQKALQACGIELPSAP